ncbi:MAG: nicotinamide mononucleotide transporter [Clostridia bacterium]|nr:nicotinamide mononucleotide transporter [Clostridia bacterium]
MKKASYFTKGELILWLTSVTVILASFVLFDRSNYLALIASLTGTTALILNAKGNPLGQVLIIIFGVLYGIISYSSAYYGEMITYLGMSVPMAVFSLISWLKNPYNGNKAEVKIARLKRADIAVMLILTVIVTVAFYFILKAFNTANLLPSTVSVSTSFIAVYLTYKRSPYFALGYVANDLVLIVLWIIADNTEASYLSVIICFVIFLANDIYTYVNWLKIRKRQSSEG